MYYPGVPNARALLLASTLLATACGPTLAEDFDQFCRVVNEVNKDPNLPTEEKLAKIAGRSAEYMQSPESKAADNVWTKLNNTAPDKKYAATVDAAHAAGKADWRCGSYEKMLVTYNVEQAAKQKAAEEKLKAADAEKEKAAAATPPPPAEPEKKSKKAAKKSGKKKKKR